jgi:hypothetical protein
MPNKWHICKEGQAGNNKKQRRGLLVFSELPRIPLAGSLLLSLYYFIFKIPHLPLTRAKL